MTDRKALWKCNGRVVRIVGFRLLVEDRETKTVRSVPVDRVYPLADGRKVPGRPGLPRKKTVTTK